MKSAISLAVGSAVALALTLGSARPAEAHDETDDTDIKVQAPLESVDCTTSTLGVLGRHVDISQASNSDMCPELVVGQMLELQFASDAEPLAASKIEPQGSGGGEGSGGGGGCSDGDDGDKHGEGHDLVRNHGGDDTVKIEAPVQSVDATLKTVTVLGVTVDVSTANLQGADDDDGDGTAQPIDLTTLVAGQFVELSLDAAKLPQLVALSLEVKNFTNGVQVDVVDSDGQEVEDVDDQGNPVADIDVDATVSVQSPAASGLRAARTGHAHRTRKVIHLRTKSSGSVTLAGLPTGRAKIVVTRVKNGTTTRGRRRLSVRANTTRTLRIVLH